MYPFFGLTRHDRNISYIDSTNQQPYMEKMQTSILVEMDFCQIQNNFIMDFQVQIGSYDTAQFLQPQSAEYRILSIYFKGYCIKFTRAQFPSNNNIKCQCQLAGIVFLYSTVPDTPEASIYQSFYFKQSFFVVLWSLLQHNIVYLSMLVILLRYVREVSFYSGDMSRFYKPEP